MAVETKRKPKHARREKNAVQVLVQSCQDVGSRNIQQDAMLFSDMCLSRERGVLAVLADGMGGMRRGEVYSALAVKEMMHSFEDEPPGKDPCDVLLKAYTHARCAALHMDANGDGGATVAAALVKDMHCAFLSVGDSRIYLLRGGGLIRLNREQTLGVQLDEAAALGYIPVEEARYNRFRHTLTNHLCLPEDMPCDRCTQSFALKAGDKLALMSDGVFSALKEEEILCFLQKPGTSGAEAMIREIRCRKMEKQDNCSVMILALEASQP